MQSQTHQSSPHHTKDEKESQSMPKNKRLGIDNQQYRAQDYVYQKNIQKHKSAKVTEKNLIKQSPILS